MIIDPFGKVPSEILETIPIEKGGTGATTKKQALLNLGLTEETTKTFSGSSENSYIINVLTYVESKISLKSGVFMFNAQWEGKGYGTAIAWQSSDDIKALLLYNSAFGLKYYVYTIANGWQEVPLGGGTVLYDNASGTSGTVTLSDDVSNYKYLDIYFRAGIDANNSKNASHTRLKVGEGSPTSLAIPRSYSTYNGSSMVRVISITSAVASATGTTLTVEGVMSYRLEGSGSLQKSENTVTVTRVVGYKN